MGTEQQKITYKYEEVIKCDFSDESEQAINELINLLFAGSYECHAMRHYFRRLDVYLKGVSDYHHELASFQYDLAQKLMNYLGSRGCRVVFNDIKAPKDEQEWSKTSLECCLYKFKRFYDQFINLYKQAVKNSDLHLINFIQTEVITDISDTIVEIAGKIKRFNRCSTEEGLGEYVFDRDLREWICSNCSSKNVISNVLDKVLKNEEMINEQNENNEC